MNAAFQDRMVNNLCFGCGADNHHGLRIKSYWDGDETVCDFQPEPHHSAGPPHVLNGGIIATLIDCHSVCTAMAHAYRSAGREIGSEPPLWFVTGGLRVSFLKPTPIDEPVRLRARLSDGGERKTVIACQLMARDEITVEAEVIAVRVTPEFHQP